ncbi:MAG TPA: NAD(P)H-quinone dehydrogenase [Actinomycetales bacterium]|nr:NAD(P)H-quinone dehydrogenase [Actinomycetales bacterium]
MSAPDQRVVVVGGGPGGYESALVAAQLGARVTVVDRDGLGGAAVLTDCVPSKTLISSADFMTRFVAASGLGVRVADDESAPRDVAEATETSEAADVARADLRTVNARVKQLARAQSDDIAQRMAREGVTVLQGTGRLEGPQTVVVEDEGGTQRLEADVVLVATGATPRVLDSARPDGERILTWQQVYDLPALPEKLIVVGSGVTGAELAHAYLGLGSDVTLVSSRDRVLPGEDAAAAEVIEGVFRRRGMTVLDRSRAQSVERTGDGVVVRLQDGRTVEGSHCIMAVGSVPSTAGLGLVEAGVRLSDSGHVQVDGVSRTSARGVYAAGDCTGVLPLASVAAMQGRIAMWHALGDAVQPLNLRAVAANVFTDPQVATVGWSQQAMEAAGIVSESVMLPLSTNARAKMQNVEDGFVKLFSRTGTGIVMGGVVVAPAASELIFPVALAVQAKLTVDQVAAAFTVYPSMSGSIAEAARQLHTRA